MRNVFYLYVLLFSVALFCKPNIVYDSHVFELAQRLLGKECGTDVRHCNEQKSVNEWLQHYRNHNTGLMDSVVEKELTDGSSFFNLIKALGFTFNSQNAKAAKYYKKCLEYEV